MTENEQVGIDAFLAENVAATKETKEVKFPRFKQPFVVEAVGADVAEDLKKQATRRTKNKAGVITAQTDQDLYVDLLVVNALVSPDVNNAKLQKSWGTPGNPVATIKKMLKIGEYTDLALAVQEVTGFDAAEDVDDLRDQVQD